MKLKAVVLTHVRLRQFALPHRSKKKREKKVKKGLLTWVRRCQWVLASRHCLDPGLLDFQGQSETKNVLVWRPPVIQYHGKSRQNTKITIKVIKDDGPGRLCNSILQFITGNYPFIIDDKSSQLLTTTITLNASLMIHAP